MTEIDERIAMALREIAPPARDSAFRLRVMARRERKQFRRQAIASIALLVAIAVVSALAARAGAYLAGIVLVAAQVLATAAVVYLPRFGRLVQHLTIGGGRLRS